MYTIRKSFSFAAAHALQGLPEEHPCSRMHGHNYKVVVELKTDNLNTVGFVVDYRELGPIKVYIDKFLDHKNLNELLLFNPTAENIAKHLYVVFKEMYPQLFAVEVSETEKTSARYEL